MAYFNSHTKIPPAHRKSYILRKRTQNAYYAITTEAWHKIMQAYALNPFVHSCGKIEGELGTTKCRHCGNCHRELFVTLERMNRHAHTQQLEEDAKVGKRDH
jgi:hypothetical protein